MKRQFFLLILITLMTSDNIFSQTKTSDTLTINRPRRSINFGNSISLGPEYLPLNPSIYGANFNYRFWYRTVTEKRTTDDIINLSAGYLRLINEDILKLKVGDMISLKKFGSSSIRLGIFADYFAGSQTQILSLDCNIGLQTHRFYFYLGGIQPLVKNKNDNNINTNISIGFDFYIINRKAYFN